MQRIIDITNERLALIGDARILHEEEEGVAYHTIHIGERNNSVPTPQQQQHSFRSLRSMTENVSVIGGYVGVALCTLAFFSLPTPFNVLGGILVAMVLFSKEK